MTNLKWSPILADAKAWVESQPFPVTLRQCFYHLVATQVIPNTVANYKTLSDRTSTARRFDGFPDFADETHSIDQDMAWKSVADYAWTAAGVFGLDHTEGQPWSVVIGVEKRGMAAAANRQFARYGHRVTALGGYNSTTIKMELSRQLAVDGRPSVLLYAGDFDASGEDILRDFVDKVPFDKVVKVALTYDQVREYQLPINPGKATDSRSAAFAKKHGTSMQVEVDALDPAVLAGLFADAVAEFMDLSAYNAVIARESRLKAQIRDALAAVA